MTKNNEVAVVGAGMAGQLMALALDHAGLDVALIDGRAAPPGGAETETSIDGRTTALAYASVRLFKRLGLWDELGPKAEPITDILVSNGQPRDRFRQGGLFGEPLHFPATLLAEGPKPQNEAALGYIVENRDLLKACSTALQTSSVTQHWGRGVAAYDASPQAGEGTLTLGGGETLTASLVVACDGRSSPLRGMMNLPTMSWGYPQTAMVFNVAHERPHGGVAHEVFYPDGPFAILPMRNNHASIVWTEKAKAAKAYIALDDEAFMAAARARIGDHLGALQLASPRQHYPLSLIYAPRLTAERFALAGDAAHGIHPIAGQGFNLGVKDVAALCDVLTEAKQTGLDLGHGSVLAQYDRWRRFDAASMSLGTDLINRLFSNNVGPLKHARGLALGLVQRSDPARRFFMRASGADLGTLPRLMQPL